MQLCTYDITVLYILTSILNTLESKDVPRASFTVEFSLRQEPGRDIVAPSRYPELAITTTLRFLLTVESFKFVISESIYVFFKISFQYYIYSFLYCVHTCVCLGMYV